MKLTLSSRSKRLLEEHPEFTTKWISGLRSGKYTQHRGEMCDPGVKSSACCLHVMEMECNGKEWSDGVSCGRHSFAVPSSMKDNFFRFSENDAPETLKAFDENGSIYDTAMWNDSLCLSFNQIAYLLEKGEIEFPQEISL
jgi:hypothetical protein